MNQQSSSSIRHVLSDLPHGPEFRFVDEVIQLEPGANGVGTYEVTGNEDFLKGHFPGRPMMPAVIMVEALAQLGGVVAQSDPELTPLSDLRLTAMRNVKVFGAAIPGDTLRLEAKVAGRLGNLIQVEGQVSVGETIMVKAQVTLSGQSAEPSNGD